MIGYTPTPDFYNEYICHSNLSDDELVRYGTKGMKWGRRKRTRKALAKKYIRHPQSKELPAIPEDEPYDENHHRGGKRGGIRYGGVEYRKKYSKGVFK